MQLGGTPASSLAQINTVAGQLVVGTAVGADSPAAALDINGGVTTVGDSVAVGRGNGTNNASTALTLNNDAVVTSPGFSLGFSNGLSGYTSSPTASFNGTSRYTDSGAFRIGESANGANGVSTVNVNDSAAVFLTSQTGPVIVGQGGNGIFNQNGGTVTAVSPVTLGSTAGITGTYNLNGGTLTVPGLVKGGGTGVVNFNGGTLRAGASDNPAGTTPVVFLTGVTANVGNGGAIIDTNGFTVTAASALVPAGGSGTGGLTKAGPGRLNLTAANTYTGLTTIDGGTLNVNHVGSPTTGSLNATGGVVVNQGGTLLLSGSATVNARVNDAAPVTLNGGTFALAGVAEGGGGAGGLAATGTVGVGALTLTARSIIDLQGTSLLHLAGSGTANGDATAFGGLLSVYHWNGSSAGGGAEQLLFGTTDSDESLTATQLGQISFYSDDGNTFLGTARFAGLNDGEIVPVPEPFTGWAGALTVGLLGFAQRRRLMGWLNRRRVA